MRDDLLELENVILTPHVGFRTEEALKNLARMTIENIGNLREDPTHRLLPEVPK